jgi:two-component system cell cycle sensor histidine kinase/response regulator CckA
MEVRRSVKSVSQPATAGILDEAARALSEHSPDGFVILGAPGDWTFTFVNAAAELLFGPANALIGRPFLNVFPESARSLVATALEAAYRTREPKDILAPHHRDDAVLEMRFVAITNAVAVHFRDISVLALRERQQAAAAAVGLRAISGVPFEELCGYAVDLVQSALLVDFVYVVELRTEREQIVRAHVGRRDMNPVGRKVESDNSIASYVIRTGQPVVTADFARENRYTLPPAVHEASARSAAAVPIRGRHGPFGSLIVMNRATHEFRPEDVAFLQTTANVLAATVDRGIDQAALRNQEELFRAITEFGRELIVIVKVGGSTTYISPSGARMLGHDALAVLGRPFLDLIHPDDRGRVATMLDEVATAAGSLRSFSARVRMRDGGWMILEGTGYNMLHHPAVKGLVVNARDVTQRVEAEDALRRSEEQLHQALKMEAVGRLAGGIAHDFNNLLTAIRGYSDMVAAGLSPADPLRGDVEEIQRASDRAAGLTHQLLAFSRRQVLRPDRLDLASVARNLERMVQRLIGEDVELAVIADRPTRIVLVDRGQIEQVILNLVINARDAMPSGGRLTLEATDLDILSTRDGRVGSPPPGQYAVIRVEDSGAGIPPEILDRVFEPFFTTKGPGKGTGLGLSTAYGIVKQSGGFIDVRSAVGSGTSVQIYLPAAALQGPGPESPAIQPPEGRVHHGGETILLVEDADAVRDVVRRTLAKMGYRVFDAANGPQAIDLARAHGNEIDLVLSDFVMPHMGGRELIDRIRELGIAPKILIMSGYIDDALLRGGGFPPGAAFIEKPFTADALGRRVRDVLDGVESRTNSSTRSTTE